MITWDPETEAQNRREIKIARALIEAAVGTEDVETLRRLNQAALMHLERADPQAAQEATA